MKLADDLMQSVPTYFVVPAEHNVISKERRSGSYHLSAYYLAKLFSELPLVIILPSIFYIITYWCGGFNGWTSFFAIWFVVLINSIVAQVWIASPPME